MTTKHLSPTPKQFASPTILEGLDEEDFACPLEVVDLQNSRWEATNRRVKIRYLSVQFDGLHRFCVCLEYWEEPKPTEE